MDVEFSETNRFTVLVSVVVPDVHHDIVLVTDFEGDSVVPLRSSVTELGNLSIVLLVLVLEGEERAHGVEVITRATDVSSEGSDIEEKSAGHRIR